jgi:hypothetical protein
MFSLIKSIIWLIGLAVVAYFILGYFGYEVNRSYFSDSKEKCQQQLKECSQELLKKGTEGAQCDFQCVDPKLIIKKK